MTVRNGPFLLAALALSASSPAAAQLRARDLGVAPGVFRPGPHNAITDVAGVRVGHLTLDQGDSIHTGVTAILPHGGNPFLERVPAAIHVGNGFGKLLGITQVRELGELETPILLTCTLCVWRAADALVAWMLDQPGMERARSINPVIGETNDGGLNAIRLRPIEPAQVRRALEAADTGVVAEGAVGAGRGTRAFCWKGGIGSASRVVPRREGGWTVGVLVQSNFGGMLQVMGAPVGRELGCFDFRDAYQGDGSIMIVVATDAPILARNLERLAARALLGLGRTGSYSDNGSGDYVIAFSTSAALRRRPGEGHPAAVELGNEELGPLFAAVVEATEEAIYNSLFMATAVTARGRTVGPLPLDRVRTILARYGIRPR